MDNQNKFLSAGIDVSSETLDVFFMNKREEGMHKVFSNTESGVKKLSECLKKHSFKGKIVMESTGRYHEFPAVTLFAQKYSVFVINPLRAKKYCTSQIRKLKTDKNDSRILAEMGLKEKYLDAFTLSEKEMKTKKRIALIRSLEEKLQELKAMFKNYKTSQKKLGNELSEIEKSLYKNIRSMDKQRMEMEKEVIDEVFPENDKKALEAKEILMSISGVSMYYAALIYFFYSAELGKTSGSWIAYTGLEISIAESGNWRGKGRLTKRGNRYLRKRNFGAGWGAIMNDSSFRKYYDLLKSKNRKHTEAITIIGRKILRIAFSCLKYGKRFDSSVLEKLMLRY